MLALNHADVTYVTEFDILIVYTLTGAMLIFCALLGGTGVILNSRPILAIYSILLWPAFISLMAVGYLAYRRATFALEHKLDFAWSQFYTPGGRLSIQDSLNCCGYYSALHDSIASGRCYPRTILPGCKGRLLRFEREHLRMVWTIVFSVAPVHIASMVIALLCANHITKTFGKGLTPKIYRLSLKDVREDAAKIRAEQIKRDMSWVYLDHELSRDK